MRRGSLAELRRRGPNRPPRRRILLVCEGEKTERIYFSLFLRALRAANVSLEIAKRECGSDPLSIVRFAKALVKADSGIDECYCVIDRDSHAHFTQAISEAKSFAATLRQSRTFLTIKSYPCFEYWFLCHFTFTTAPFVATGNGSAGDAAVRMLRTFVPNYSKNDFTLIEAFLTKTDEAIKNAQKALEHAEANDNFNPSTEVQKVVRVLQSFT